MKKYLILAMFGLCACETPVEIAAREQLEAACMNGNLEACAAVQQKRSADDQTLAILMQ